MANGFAGSGAGDCISESEHFVRPPAVRPTKAFAAVHADELA
jgi:hypothetical protein